MSGPDLLLLAVPLLPLATAGVVAIFGRRMPDRGAWAVLASTTASGAALLVLVGEGPLWTASEWMAVEGLHLTVGLRLDGLALAMGLLVAGVATVINAYAVGYARHERGRARFHAWMAAFSGSMLLLVLADSLVLLFAAWEGVGLASWALIAHRRTAPARRAGRMAFVMTRLADGGFLLAWLLALGAARTTTLEPAAAALAAHPALATTAAALLLVAALGKSAQVPFSAWLPEAMAGPTPVSALLHSATMVAAGVYLVLRLWPVFEAAPAVLAALRWVGGGTALVAALAATAQPDLKRVLAWSTVSQLGEMMLALGLAGPFAAFLHLTAHATFKAPLFLAAGILEHGTGTRDLRRLGGLARALPWTAGAFGLSAAALAGVPPLGGYFSGEHLLAVAVSRPGWAALFVVLVGLAGIYAGRAFGAAFLGRRRPGDDGAQPAPPERPGRLLLGPTLALAAAAAMVGLAVHPLERALPFTPEGGTPGLGWRVGVLAAGLLGLGLGALRGLRGAGAPALGRAAAWPGAAVGWLASATAGLTLAVAARLPRLEAAFDAGARGLARAARGAASGADRSEGAFDGGGRGAARLTRALARVSAALDDRGLSPGGDALARGLGWSGGRLRLLQSGKVYLYTFSLFLIAALAGLAGVVWWM